MWVAIKLLCSVDSSLIHYNVNAFIMIQIRDTLESPIIQKIDQDCQKFLTFCYFLTLVMLVKSCPA